MEKFVRLLVSGIMAIILGLFVGHCIYEAYGVEKGRVFLTNFLKCPRAYMLVNADGVIIVAEGELAKYGYESKPGKDEEIEPFIGTGAFPPPWTDELLLSPGNYVLTIWCPHGDSAKHKRKTMKNIEFTITEKDLFPPEGEGPLTIEITEDKK